MRIDEVEGIGAVYAEKLAAAGVTSTDDLLEKGAKPGGRDALEAATGISGTLLLEWVNHVDLMRIKGVGSEYSDLLEAAGVDSPAELARRMLLHERVVLRVDVMQHRVRLHRRVAEAHVHRAERDLAQDGGEDEAEADCEEAEGDESDEVAHREACRT